MNTMPWIYMSRMCYSVAHESNVLYQHECCLSVNSLSNSCVDVTHFIQPYNKFESRKFKVAFFPSVVSLWRSVVLFRRRRPLFVLCACCVLFSVGSCIFEFRSFNAPPQHVHSQLPVFIPNLFLSTFLTKHNKTGGGKRSACRGPILAATLSMNSSPSPSPSAIYKQSFPYAVEGVTALTEGGMLLGEILFSNDTEVIWGSVSDSITAFCRFKMFDPEVPVTPVVNGR